MPLPRLLLAAAPLLPLPKPAPSAGADAEILVEEQRDPIEAREAVGEALQAFGYGEGRERGGVVTYRAPRSWYPDISLHPHGTVQHRWPVRHKVALVLFGDFKKAKSRRGDIVRAIHPDVFAWREALAAEAMTGRYDRLPDQLALLWIAGVPLQDDAPLLRTSDERRAALLAFWATRTCTPEGRRVRGIALDFLREVVQPSPWPVTPAEVAQTNARTPCGDRL
jgi:hypothetical protein